MAMHQENLTAALALASAGIKIFPAGADKRPLLKGWQDAATSDADHHPYLVGARSRVAGDPVWTEQPGGDRL